jgi:hypothetical protein
MWRVSFILTLNYGLEGMQSVDTWDYQRITAVSAVVIMVNMMLGANINVW